MPPFWGAFSDYILLINSCTPLETAQIKATIWSWESSNYNCFECTKKFKDPKMQENYQRMKLCYEKKDIYPYRIENIQFKTCPGNFTLPQMNYLMDSYWDYTIRGVMPEKGGLFDLTYKTYDIFGIIKESVRAIEKKKSDRDKSRTRSRAKK